MRTESDCCFLSVNKVVADHINKMLGKKAFIKGISNSKSDQIAGGIFPIEPHLLLSGL